MNWQKQLKTTAVQPPNSFAPNRFEYIYTQLFVAATRAANIRSHSQPYMSVVGDGACTRVHSKPHASNTQHTHTHKHIDKHTENPHSQFYSTNMASFKSASSRSALLALHISYCLVVFRWTNSEPYFPTAQKLLPSLLTKSLPQNAWLRFACERALKKRA